MTFDVAGVTVSPLVPFAWALFVGLVFSTIGAAGGILAAVGHITVLGVADANVVKPMSQLLVVVSPLVSVPAYWRQRRLVIAVALLIGGGAVAGSLLGSWYSTRYLGSMRDYRVAFGVLTLLIALRLWYESTARFRARNARLRETAKAFERTRAGAPGGARAETRWRFPGLDVVLAGHVFPCNVASLVLTGGVVAFVSAALGVGGGFLLVPYLTSWLGLPMFVVAGTSALAVLVAALVSVGNYLYLGVRVDWLLAAVEVAGVVLGSLLGPWVSRYMREGWLRLALALVLAYIGVAYTLPGGLGWWLGV
ncbi:MAG: sulfite exporter TauE/SafE family protein [Candidatus Rokubacteria bacterium]|nr:sulfite exporter TauE/SafE family protein [Candidatus Rokubacteria bacterium]